MVLLTDKQGNIKELENNVFSEMVFDCVCTGLDEGGNQNFNYNNIVNLLSENGLANTKRNKEELASFLNKEESWSIQAHQL